MKKLFFFPLIFCIHYSYALNNLKEFIILDGLEKLNNVGIKKVFHEDKNFQLSLPNGSVINEGGILAQEVDIPEFIKFLNEI